MKTSFLIVLLMAIVLVPSPADASLPVCLVKTVDAPHAHAEVWVTCGIHAEITVCGKDGFCHTLSTEEFP